MEPGSGWHPKGALVEGSRENFPNPFWVWILRIEIQFSGHLIHFCEKGERLPLTIFPLVPHNRQEFPQKSPKINTIYGLECSGVLGSGVLVSASSGVSLRKCCGSQIPWGAPLIGRQLKESPQTGGRGFRDTFPHSTRSPQLGSEWSWLGNPVKTFRNSSEGLVLVMFSF